MCIIDLGGWTHICMILPADLLHSSPCPHFESLQSFYYVLLSRGRRLRSLQHLTPQQCLCRPFLHVYRPVKCSSLISKVLSSLRMSLFLLLSLLQEGRKAYRP